jgi:uncharacterized membrane protein
MLPLIFILSFFLRLIAVDQSLWLDEAVTAKVVKSFSYIEIVKNFSPGDFHPPLYYLFMKLWTNIFGYSEISLRMPSVIFSLLIGYIIYLIGKQKKAGLWAVVFFLFNPLIVYYSQEARMYMMATFFLTSALYYLVNNKNIFLLALFTILSFWTFYGSIFLIVPMLGYLLIKKQYHRFVASTIMILFAFLVTSPLLYRQFINSRIALQTVTNWSLVLGKANFKNLLLIPIKFSFGRISFYPKQLYYLLSAVWTGVVFLAVIKGGLKNKPLLFLLFIPILLGFAISFFSPLLQYFRFLYLIPLMSLLISFGIKKDRYRIIISLGFVILSLTYLLNPSFHREDWKSLAKNLSNERQIYMVTSSSDPLLYYNPTLRIADLEEMDLKTKNETKITVIPYTADIHGIDYEKMLLMKNFSLEKKIAFRELLVEKWLRR